MRILLIALFICVWMPAMADIGYRPLSPGADAQLCRAAIAMAERRAAIPNQLLSAIGRVESGRRDSASGVFGPWPWTVNAEGEGFFFDSKAQAIAAVQKMRSRGVQSIDVGCMQINLMHHPNAFASLEAAFDPASNAAYAASFLRQLQSQAGSWPQATAMYHSSNPELGTAYQRKVMAALPEEQRLVATEGSFSFNPPPVTAFLPPQRTSAAHILPLADGAMPGRGLAAYRSMPIAMISRLRRFGG